MNNAFRRARVNTCFEKPWQWPTALRIGESWSGEGRWSPELIKVMQLGLSWNRARSQCREREREREWWHGSWERWKRLGRLLVDRLIENLERLLDTSDIDPCLCAWCPRASDSGSLIRRNNLTLSVETRG